MIEASNPFMKKRVDTVDLRNALSDITTNIQEVQGYIAKFEATLKADHEITMCLNLSSLEIKMSNFAKMLREAYA